MSKAWLLRPRPHNIDRFSLFKMDHFIAIGWPNLGDLSKKSKEEIRTLLTLPPYQYSSLSLGNSTSTIDLFVNQMQIGDYVLIPNGADIHFATIESDYYFKPEYDAPDIGCSHQRKIKWLNRTLRSELPLSLRNSLKVHRSATNLSTHFDIIAALAQGKVPKFISAKTDLVDVSYPLRPDLFITFQIPKDINATESERFADFIKTLHFH